MSGTSSQRRAGTLIRTSAGVLVCGLIAGLGLGLNRAEAEAETETRTDADTSPAAVEFFEREVRPILVERCQGCHGPSKSKAELRLDSREAALAGGQSGPSVVPGKPGESLLIEAINYGDLQKMPPRSKLPAARSTP